MQKQKTGKISIFSSFDVKLEFLTSRVKLTQFSVGSSRVKLKIWAIWLESSWKCEQFDSISIWIQNVNSKLNLMISLIMTVQNKMKMMFQTHFSSSSEIFMLNTKDFKYLFLIENDASLMHCKIKRVVYKMMFDKTLKHIKYINRIMCRLVEDASE